MSDQIKSVARLIGNSYAHVQDGIDRLTEWGFDQMRKQAEEDKKNRSGQRKQKPVVRKMSMIGKGVLGFLGAAGDAYFRTYSELKKKR